LVYLRNKLNTAEISKITDQVSDQVSDQDMVARILSFLCWIFTPFIESGQLKK